MLTSVHVVIGLEMILKINVYFLGDASGRYSYCVHLGEKGFVSVDVQCKQIEGTIKISGMERM